MTQCRVATRGPRPFSLLFTDGSNTSTVAVLDAVRTAYRNGEDLCKLPLTMRKTNLARLLARRVDGIHAASFEQGVIGPDLFRHACLMGLEGLSQSTGIVSIEAAGHRAG